MLSTETWQLVRISKVRSDSRSRLPRSEDLFVLQLLHSGGGRHRHGDHYVVYVEGTLTTPPLDWLLLKDEKTSTNVTDLFSTQSEHV